MNTTYEYEITQNGKYFFNQIFAVQGGVKKQVRGKVTAHASQKQAVDQANAFVERYQAR